MNYWVCGILLFMLIGFRLLKVNLIVWAVAWWVTCLVILKFGITPPLPSTVVSMFLGIVTVGIIAYFSSSMERTSEVTEKAILFMTDKRYKALLYLVILLVPLLLAINVYITESKPIQAPVFGRTVHPAPPATINFKGKKIDILKDQNPFRELEKTDPEKFGEHVENGRKVYYQNCVFCHADYLDGKGLVAHGMNPVPANFVDPTTIAMLTETFLFWRIADGGVGMPEESGPWATTMPAWKNFLTEDEIWEVILFLYDFTDQKPRSNEEHEHE